MFLSSHRVLLTATASLALLGACADGADETDEAGVCESVQSMVDHLTAGESTDAILEIARLKKSADATDNEVLSRSVGSFVETTSEQVSDAEVTVEEAAAEGRAALFEGADALGRVVDECNRLELELELPRYDAEGNRL